MNERIVKRECVDGRVIYVIQQRHFVFRWWWVDAWVNSGCREACKYYFDSHEEAKKNLCYFDGSTSKDTVLK